VAAYLSGNNVTSYELGFKRDLAKIAAFLPVHIKSQMLNMVLEEI
jgi:hypothetical protein